MDCAAIAERIVTKVTVRVLAVILWSRILVDLVVLVNFVGVMAVFWRLVGWTTVLRTVHFLFAVIITRAVNNITVVIVRAVVIIARTVYVAASRTVIGNVTVVVITVVTVVIVRAVNVNAALGSYVTHVVIVVTTFVHVVPSVT